jgi:two-component system, chemotaxis family, CheB/CheR fusion protein
MAFVLVQHLDPHHKSLLVELLAARASMPVMEAADGMAVRENSVYVIPPDGTLTIKDGILRVVSPAPPRELRRPIDTFFSSLADCGDKAVGIILSGVGTSSTGNEIGRSVVLHHAPHTSIDPVLINAGRPRHGHRW